MHTVVARSEGMEVVDEVCPDWTTCTFTIWEADRQVGHGWIDTDGNITVESLASGGVRLLSGVRAASGGGETP